MINKIILARLMIQVLKKEIDSHENWIGFC